RHYGANSDINIATGNPTIAGSLDKSIIARIIKKHYSQIKYCYQKELNKNPKLYGKITIKFTISPNGTVSSSVVSVTTMKNVAVEECVAKTIKRIVFPAPKGGGIVVVTYPFIFKAEGV
ncbi:MAG: TonB family protein, partial [Myxococcales bacterium]